MSELQAALLTIGFGVIVAVYVFGWWQQRRYRRKFGAAFKANHADALYQGSAGMPAGQVRQSPLSGMAGAAVIEAAIADVEIAEASVIESPAGNLLDDPCSLLDARSDFIIELRLSEPSHAAVLDGLWQRKFDFRKPVQVCGLALGTQKWERAIAESQALYARFRIALQLVDRGGAISEARLADFRDLVLGIAGHIKADATVPDIHETYRHAAALDAFCAEVDQMAGINLVPPSGRLLPGGRIAQAAAQLGMTLEADGAFHLLDAQGRSRFSLGNQDGRPFQHLNLETFSTAGITLLLDVPRVEDPGSQFDRMMQVARELAGELQVDLVDDHRAPLSDSGLALIRARINDVELKMCAQGLTPGSTQARRLFS
ncbi:MAG TPA: cell division protein ZipA C-terminal FtsZ-binding domain-containing protein [Gallionella sp.]|nr:cell division protein ZipA C-terminal FtsZ-binding domain-containing protein [Gallionella sp.]